MHSREEDRLVILGTGMGEGDTSLPLLSNSHRVPGSSTSLTSALAPQHTVWQPVEEPLDRFTAHLRRQGNLTPLYLMRKQVNFISYRFVGSRTEVCPGRQDAVIGGRRRMRPSGDEGVGQPFRRDLSRVWERFADGCLDPSNVHRVSLIDVGEECGDPRLSSGVSRAGSADHAPPSAERR